MNIDIVFFRSCVVAFAILMIYVVYLFILKKYKARQPTTFDDYTYRATSKPSESTPLRQNEKTFYFLNV